MKASTLHGTRPSPRTYNNRLRISSGLANLLCKVGSHALELMIIACLRQPYTRSLISKKQICRRWYRHPVANIYERELSSGTHENMTFLLPLNIGPSEKCKSVTMTCEQHTAKSYWRTTKKSAICVEIIISSKQNLHKNLVLTHSISGQFRGHQAPTRWYMYCGHSTCTMP